MKHYSENELFTIVNKVMGDEDWKINIIKHTKKELLFEATHMYDWNNFTPSYKHLKMFEDEFKSNNIDKYDDISITGCETCDYGSSYGFALRVWD